MGSTPDRHRTSEDGGRPAVYEPTDPGALLTRTMQRSRTLRRRVPLAVSGLLSMGLAIALALAFLPSAGPPGPSVASRYRHGAVKVSSRIGDAVELTAAARRVESAPAQVVAAVEHAEVGFSLALLDRLAAAAGTQDALVSPSSLAIALAMLQLGAVGSTEQGIATTLQSSGLSASQQAAGWSALNARLEAETGRTGADLSQRPELDVANALWIQKSFAVRPQFVRAVSANFQAGTWQADFAHDLPAAVDAINQWTSEHTAGTIRQLFSPGAIDSSTVLVLADAVYLHALWQSPLTGSPDVSVFHLPGGRTEMAKFMATPEMPPSLSWTDNSHISAVELPYKGGNLSALVVMPKGDSLPSYVSSLTPSGLASVVGSLKASKLNLEMPQLNLTADDRLETPLSAMGMAQAFGPAADLSGIAPDLQVQSVEQRAYLKVTPRGTVASAATGIGIEPTSAVGAPSHTIVIDRPFLFLVRDNTTGTILFEAMVQDPNATQAG